MGVFGGMKDAKTGTLKNLTSSVPAASGIGFCGSVKVNVSIPLNLKLSRGISSARTWGTKITAAARSRKKGATIRFDDRCMFSPLGPFNGNWPVIYA